MKKRLRIGGVSEHFNLPWQLALDDDAFLTQNVLVDFHECPGGTGQMTEALRNGELDAALVLTEGAVADVLNNDECRLVKVYVDSPLIWGIHVAADSDIEEVGAIRDKRFAISRHGSGSHLIAIVDAVDRGWRTDNMKFCVVNTLDGARKALASGDADVFLWERHMTQQLIDRGEFRRVGEREVPWPAFVVSVRCEFLTDACDELRATLAIVENYADELRRNLDPAALIAETYGIAEHDAASWLQHVRWARGFEPPIAALQTICRTLVSQRLVDDTPFDLKRLWHQL